MAHEPKLQEERDLAGEHTIREAYLERLAADIGQEEIEDDYAEYEVLDLDQVEEDDKHDVCYECGEHFTDCVCDEDVIEY